MNIKGKESTSSLATTLQESKCNTIEGVREPNAGLE
jgi:hypothetical protein